jgi:AraC-like DNA-binding protein
MDLDFCTDELDPLVRLAAWQELVNRVFIPLAIRPLAADGGAAGPGGFAGSATGRDVGGLRAWRVAGTPMAAIRASRHVRATAGDDYLLALHIGGTAAAVQGDRQVTLQPGDLALFDSARPYSITFTAAPGRHFEHLIFQVPRASLDARCRQIAAATALAVPGCSDAGQLTGPYLRALARPGWAATGPSAARPFVELGLDLAVSALRTVAGGTAHPGHDQQGAVSQLKRYALAQLELGDPALTPATAARASYLSTRQLHRLFAAEGTTFGAWLREQRLRRCQDDLADPRLGHLAVADIGARWGYRSPAHFSRVFTARFGSPPGQARRAPSGPAAERGA